jgi:hypothetical protein
MTPQTRQLPRTLKKKLEASLESLTPRESGRLFLLYYHEERAKNIPPSRDYPPVKELEDAWQKRLEVAKKRGVAEYNAEAARFNGYWFLASLAATANMFAEGDLWRIVLLGMMTRQKVENLLYQDAVSEIARNTVGDLVRNMPRPVSREAYDRMVAWANTDALDLLTDIVDGIVEDWEEDQGFKYHEVPLEFWEAHKDKLDDLLKTLPKDADWPQGFKPRRDLVAELKELATTEEDSPLDKYTVVYSDAVRMLYVWVEGDRLLKEVFGGDPDRVAYWLAYGDYTDPAEHAAVKAKDAEVLQSLTDLLAAGKLTGGPAFDLPGLWSPVLIRDGKLPAWVGLRFAWDDWLADRGVSKRDMPAFFDDKAIEGTWSLYDAAGDLTGDRLTALVGDFVKDCRSRPWGKHLPRKVDLPALAAWLTAVESPLTQIDAPDLGLIDWEAFRSREGDESDMWEPKPAATAASLTKALYEGEGDTWRVAKPEESYYPTRDDHARRRLLHNINARLNSLRVSHRAFTYREKPKAGQLSLQEFLGMDFYTPLEEAVKHLGEAQGEVAMFRKAYDTLSDKYFGGLPILAEEYRERLDMIEGLLVSAGEDLEDWLDRLARWPWSVDVSKLRAELVKAGEDKAPAEHRVAERVEVAEKFALISFKGDPSFIDLGEDDPPPDKAKSQKGAKP